MSTGPDEGMGPRRHRQGFISVRAAVIGAVLLVLLSSLGTYAAVRVLTPLYPSISAAAALREADNWERFLEVVSFVHENYVDPETASMDHLLEGAIKGIISALDDPYSAYFDRARVENFERETRGTYEGIGVQVVSRSEGDASYATVVAAFPSSPAAETPFADGTPDAPVGLMPGDRILSVDGQDVVDIQLDVVAELIRGPEGTAVTLEIQRDGFDTPLVFTVLRAAIVVPTASSEVLPGRVGYLRIILFNAQTPEQVEEELAGLLAAGIEGLVVDLRNNPGGRLDETIDVASLLLAEGPVVHIQDRAGSDMTYTSQGPGLDLPMAVLINEGSASASEILAAAIRERADAQLVGQPTFGKNSVQTFYPLRRGGDDTAAVKLTVATFFTPSGEPLAETGLEPDIPVEMPSPTAFGNLEEDEPLRAAVDWLTKEAGAVVQGLP